MNANQTCDHVLNFVKNSNLNYSINESPFSVTISIKKTFIKDKSGCVRGPKIDEFPRYNCQLLDENKTLTDENQFLQADIGQQKSENKALKNTVKNLGITLEKTKDELAHLLSNPSPTSLINSSVANNNSTFSKPLLPSHSKAPGPDLPPSDLPYPRTPLDLPPGFAPSQIPTSPTFPNKSHQARALMSTTMPNLTHTMNNNTLMNNTTLTYLTKPVNTSTMPFLTQPMNNSAMTLTTPSLTAKKNKNTSNQTSSLFHPKSGPLSPRSPPPRSQTPRTPPGLPPDPSLSSPNSSSTAQDSPLPSDAKDTVFGLTAGYLGMTDEEFENLKVNLNK